MKVKIDVEIENQAIADVLCTAIEDGLEWLRSVKFLGQGVPEGKKWYENGSIIESAYFSLEASYDNPDQGASVIRKTINAEDISKGIELMSVKDRQGVMDIITGNYDIETADSLMQYTIFGKIIYS